MSEENYYKKCSNCKKEIAFGATYQMCTVSTCKKNAYCSVDCWDIHLPILNHKSAWAEETRAPNRPSQRRILVSTSKSSLSSQASQTSQRNYGKSADNTEILIVVSKLKSYIKNKADMNTSANVMAKLSTIVRIICDQAISEARAEGRRTLMDRDFK